MDAYGPVTRADQNFVAHAFDPVVLVRVIMMLALTMYAGSCHLDLATREAPYYQSTPVMKDFHVNTHGVVARLPSCFYDAYGSQGSGCCLRIASLLPWLRV
jgi:hypothetical protein